MSSAMAWLARLRSPLATEIDRQIALVRIRAQVVVAHEAVEVERRGRAGIGLDGGKLGQVLEPLGRRHQRTIRLFEARAARQVDDDLDLRLVVERQQLDAHVLGREQRAGRERREADGDEEELSSGSAL